MLIFIFLTHSIALADILFFESIPGFSDLEQNFFQSSKNPTKKVLQLFGDEIISVNDSNFERTKNRINESETESKWFEVQDSPFLFSPDKENFTLLKVSRSSSTPMSRSNEMSLDNDMSKDKVISKGKEQASKLDQDSGEKNLRLRIRTNGDGVRAPVLKGKLRIFSRPGFEAIGACRAEGASCETSAIDISSSNTQIEFLDSKIAQVHERSGQARWAVFYLVQILRERSEPIQGWVSSQWLVRDRGEFNQKRENSFVSKSAPVRLDQVFSEDIKFKIQSDPSMPASKSQKNQVTEMNSHLNSSAVSPQLSGVAPPDQARIAPQPPSDSQIKNAVNKAFERLGGKPIANEAQNAASLGQGPLTAPTISVAQTPAPAATPTAEVQNKEPSLTRAEIEKIVEEAVKKEIAKMFSQGRSNETPGFSRWSPKPTKKTKKEGRSISSTSSGSIQGPNEEEHQNGKKEPDEEIATPQFKFDYDGFFGLDFNTYKKTGVSDASVTQKSAFVGFSGIVPILLNFEGGGSFSYAFPIGKSQVDSMTLTEPPAISIMRFDQFLVKQIGSPLKDSSLRAGVGWHLTSIGGGIYNFSTLVGIDLVGIFDSPKYFGSVKLGPVGGSKEIRLSNIEYKINLGMRLDSSLGYQSWGLYLNHSAIIYSSKTTQEDTQTNSISIGLQKGF